MTISGVAPLSALKLPESNGLDKTQRDTVGELTEARRVSGDNYVSECG